MFGVGRKSGCSGIDTVIGSQTRLEGDIRFSGGLHVDGTIKGNLVAEPGTETVLTVSEQGRIEGDVRVPNLVLNGAVQGDVYASERVELASHAKVTGNVYYNLIEMAMGAEVNGNLVHRAEPQRTPSNTAQKVESIENTETASMSVAK
ncbi:MAG: polymer-forming cytoskeletal protein [Gammaproteobacteria bacterium]|nr:MAG: polymer-forming cytoskeletal protein [Gammaproteobacteria bacterium]